MEFKIESKFKPTGDQPQAIEKIVNSINNNNKFTSLLGVTGSGKTFTMANVIEKVQKPTLIIAHNKTLAAQLYSEFKDFFPNNAVEYFVSYYNYYQPEAYVMQTDTYIEKDASINEEIDKLRHSATAAILERNDVIIISSVSCIYGLGDPKDYKELMISLRPDMQIDRDEVIKKLVGIQYERNDINFERGTFRVRGDIIEIMPANSDDTGIRIEFFGDEIERITEINYITGEILGSRNHIAIFPASHYVTSPERLENSLHKIEEELEDRVKYFKENEKLIEAQRIEQRTNYDIEMLKEIGFCQGIENYSRHITGRKEGEKPYTLMDFFPEDYLIIVDESHVTVPQVRGMYGGDRSRKESLIENGFRLPSAYDNRPLNFGEFEENINQMLFVSATPGPYEIQNSSEFAEQIIRPTGLLDPEIDVRPITNQIDNLLSEINNTVSKKERVLVTTLTKRMSEDLTDYLKNAGIKVKYLHSDIETLERTEIIRDLRMGKFDVLVGINLLREGLDIPEVSLVAILDADKEGFLRSETSLIQTVGRAARNKNGRVIMYADKITRSMESAINETNRRRELQQKYNEENNIIPQSINKEIKNVIEATMVADDEVAYGISSNIDKDELKENINRLKEEMIEAAKNLQFERAAQIRDKIAELEERIEN
ncbi:excinuclease ABC subunit UvrB [Tepidibacter sp. Z1-5]|uniref:excinuclease ABC subunit UvrB n=1 Tax=Tepidibacter sp. Z1-5 TaxID=3134138 RepID=UPI0030BAA06E